MGSLLPGNLLSNSFASEGQVSERQAEVAASPIVEQLEKDQERMVWRSGLKPTMPLSCYLPELVVCLDETSAWLRRKIVLRRWPGAHQIECDPYPMTFSEACAAGRAKGARIIEIWAPHRTERYPL